MHTDPLGRCLHEALGDVVRGAHDTLRVRPESVSQISLLFRLANTHRFHIAVPGSQLVAGRGIVTLDLDALSGIRGFDPESQTLHVEGGALVSTVEAHLRARGLTLGARSDLDPRQSVSAWLASGAPGARAHADDPVDQLLCGLHVVLADSTELTIRPAPRRAVGPDLIPAVVGGRAALGVIVGAHLVARRDTPRTQRTYRFASRDAAESARAWIRGHGVRPASITLTGDGDSTLLKVSIEGSRGVRDACLTTVARVTTERGGVPCDDATPPAPAPMPAPGPSAIVRALGRALDPANVLGHAPTEGASPT